MERHQTKTRTEEEIVALWGATLERQYLPEETSNSSGDRHSHGHFESGDSFLRRSLSDLIDNVSQNGTNYSMPTRNLSDLEGNHSEAQSTATANGSHLAYPDTPLIGLGDLGQEIPIVVNVEGLQQEKIVYELERAAFGGSLSDKLTGDGSMSDPGGTVAQPIQFPGPSRPDALARTDRCTTPQRSNVRRTNSRIPVSPGGASQQAIFHHTYETDPRTPSSPVPPFVVVPSSGVARVTIRPTARILDNFSIPPSAQQSRNQSLYKKSCLLVLTAILILALITLAAGIVRAREQAEAAEVLVPSTPQSSISGTTSPTMPESTPVPSVTTPAPSPYITSPTYKPVFSIPNEDSNVDFPDLGGGVVGREETLSPTTSDYIPPTRAPRTRRPTSSPSRSLAPSLTAPPSIAPSLQGTNRATEGASSNDIIEAEYEANMRVYLLTLISSVSPSSIRLLDLASSSQHKAFEWIVSDQMATDPILPEARIIQRFALAVFYFSTSGMNWTNSNLWLTLNNECDWYETRTHSVCDSRSNMHTLQLESNGLSGSLPVEIQLLSLRRLYLRHNHIGGRLPSELASLEVLKFLQVTNNQLTGSIPTEYGSLSGLAVLGVGRNGINGTIPTELGLLPSLDTLGLEGNHIEGSIPTEFGTISSLRVASMSSNFLSGDVPSEIGSVASLEALRVKDNDLSGNMPLEVCNLRSSTLSQLSADCDEIVCDCCTSCGSSRNLGDDPK